MLWEGIEPEDITTGYEGVLVYWEYRGINDVEHGVSSLYGGTVNMSDVHGDQPPGLQVESIHDWSALFLWFLQLTQVDVRMRPRREVSRPWRPSMKMVWKDRRQDANTSEWLQQKMWAQDYNRNLAKPADEAVFGRAFFQEIVD